MTPEIHLRLYAYNKILLTHESTNAGYLDVDIAVAGVNNDACKIITYRNGF